MYYNNKKLVLSIITAVIGLIIIALGVSNKLDSAVWSAVGVGFTAIGIAKILRNIKYRTDEKYREMIDIEAADERKKYIRMKAWSISGYAFVIVAAVASLIMRIKNMNAEADLLGFCVCFVLLAYLISMFILQKKE